VSASTPTSSGTPTVESSANHPRHHLPLHLQNEMNNNNSNSNHSSPSVTPTVESNNQSALNENSVSSPVSTSNNTPNPLANLSSSSLAKLNKAIEELSRNFVSLKQVLYGDGENEPKKNDVQDVAKEVYSTHFLLFLVSHLEFMEFEARRDAMQVFNNLIKLQMNGRYTTVDYICNNPQILYILLHGYEKDTSILSGNMLRECIKHEILARKMLSSEQDFFDLFVYVDLPNFDVASDAFLTFRELLSRHKTLVAEFLDSNYDVFIDKYRSLLSSKYVTRRQSLKLLGEILLDRSNFKIMKRFINNTDNLKLIMNLLLDKHKNIQFEAFHVFKIFVANPHKGAEVKKILFMNKVKLVKYLNKFNKDSTDDQFMEEKALLISEIEKMEKPEEPAAAAAVTSTNPTISTSTPPAANTTTTASVDDLSNAMNALSVDQQVGRPLSTSDPQDATVL